MGGYGWHNPWPFQYGGGPTATEKVYRSLQGAMGGVEGRAIGPEGGLEDAWRRAKALTIAASERRTESAAMQAFPVAITDHLDPWTERLGVDPEATDKETRDAIVASVRAQVRADCPAITAALAAFSEHLSLYVTTREESEVGMFGLTLDPDGEAGALFRGAGTQWPAYSDHFTYRVIWDHVASGLASPPSDLRARLVAYLNETLPSCVDWTIQQAPRTGFFLDGGPDGMSVLDATPLGS